MDDFEKLKSGIYDGKEYMTLATDFDWTDEVYHENGLCGIKDVFGNIVVKATDKFKDIDEESLDSLFRRTIRKNNERFSFVAGTIGEGIEDEEWFEKCALFAYEYDTYQLTPFDYSGFRYYSRYRLGYKRNNNKESSRSSKYLFNQEGELVYDTHVDEVYEPDNKVGVELIVRKGELFGVIAASYCKGGDGNSRVVKNIVTPIKYYIDNIPPSFEEHFDYLPIGSPREEVDQYFSHINNWELVVGVPVEERPGYMYRGYLDINGNFTDDISEAHIGRKRSYSEYIESDNDYDSEE